MREHKEYYANGELKYSVSLEGDVRSGPSKAYFLNGNLQENTMWHAGKQNDFSITYYPNGNIKNKSFWHNGACLYYNRYKPLGELDQKEVFNKGTRSISFYEKNIIVEKQIYDNENTLILTIAYNNSKQIISVLPELKFSENADSIKEGDTYRVNMRLTSHFATPVHIIIGNLNKYGDITDTFSIIKPKDRMYHYKIDNVKSGRNGFSYKLIQRTTDSMSVDGVYSTHHFSIRH